MAIGLNLNKYVISLIANNSTKNIFGGLIRISKAVITCVGMDKPGIIASISKILGENDINIVDIAQSFAHDFFTMIWIIDLEHAKISLRELKEKLKSLGEKMDLIIELYHEDIFRAMHRI